MRILFLLFVLQSSLLSAQSDSLLIPYRSGEKWGFSDVNKKMVIPAMYDNVTPFYQGKAFVMLGSENAVIDRKNNYLVPFSTENPEQFSNELLKSWQEKFIDIGTKKRKLVITKEREKLDTDEDFYTDSLGVVYLYNRRDFYGLLDREGNVILPCTYDRIRDEGDFYIVSKEQQEGLFDLDGKQLTPIKYMYIGSLENNLFIVRLGDKYGYINRQGRVVIPIDLEWAQTFSQGFARVKRGKWGQVDTTGKTVIPYLYDWLGPINLNVCSAKQNDKWALISSDGNELTKFEFDDIQRVYNGAIAVRKDKNWSIMNPEGQIVSNMYFDTIRIEEASEESVTNFGIRKLQYDEGYIMFKKDNKWGIVRKDGKLVIPALYELIGPYQNGVAKAKQNDKWALINSEGKFLTDFIYQSLYFVDERNESPKGPLMIFRRDNKEGFLNINGAEIIKPKFDHIVHYKNQYFRIIIDRKEGVIDEKGKAILPTIYDEIVNPSYLYLFDIFNKDKFFLVLKNGKEGYVSLKGVEYFD